jgi:hypothetical protein
MIKELINHSNRSKILKYTLSENEKKIDKNIIDSEVKEFIGNRSTDKVRYFDDDKEMCVAIIFDEDYN